MSIYFTDLHIVYLFQSMLFYLSVIVYEGTSNSLMATYFMDMLFGFLFTGVSFTVWDFTCRNFELLDVCIFYGLALCLPFFTVYHFTF